MEGQPATPREIEVARLYGIEGHMGAVAAILGVSPQTVKNHLSSLHMKTGTDNSVAMFQRLGWLRIPDLERRTRPDRRVTEDRRSGGDRRA